MKITVITATWNSERTIVDTLASFASQDHQDTEYIIVDGGSTDNTIQIIKDSNVRVDKIISEKDKGIYDALNKGIAMATGDVVGFLHSDDIFADTYVLSKIATAMQVGEVDAVYGDLDYVSKLNTNKVIRRWVSGAFDRNKMRNGWMPPHPTFYMKRDCYERFGGFNLGYRIAADYDSILRYLWSENLTVSYIPYVLIKMRVGGESNRSFMNILKKSQEDCLAMSGNGLPVLRALVGKNLSKIPQFFMK